MRTLPQRLVACVYFLSIRVFHGRRRGWNSCNFEISGPEDFFQRIHRLRFTFQNDQPTQRVRVIHAIGLRYYKTKFKGDPTMWRVRKYFVAIRKIRIISNLCFMWFLEFCFNWHPQRRFAWAGSFTRIFNCKIFISCSLWCHHRLFLYWLCCINAVWRIRRAFSLGWCGFKGLWIFRMELVQYHL